MHPRRTGARRCGWRVVDPFVDFFRRYGIATALLTLLFILLFKVPEQALVGGIMSPFYLDMGFTKTQIGAVTKLYGIWVGIAGVFAGGPRDRALGRALAADHVDRGLRELQPAVCLADRRTTATWPRSPS